MSRVTDTVERVLANLDGETKPESLSAEEAYEVYEAVADGAEKRADVLRDHVQTVAAARQDLLSQGTASDEGMPVAEAAPAAPTAPEPEPSLATVAPDAYEYVDES